jgi:hypothetical protein
MVFLSLFHFRSAKNLMSIYIYISQGAGIMMLWLFLAGIVAGISREKRQTTDALRNFGTQNGAHSSASSSSGSVVHSKEEPETERPDNDAKKVLCAKEERPT